MKILFNISAGLIRVNAESDTVALVYYTLQEYLETYPSKLDGEPEVDLALACVTYLSFNVFREGPCTTGDALTERLQEYRFLNYASANWGSHVLNSGQLHPTLHLILPYLRDERTISAYIKVLYGTPNWTRSWYDQFPRRIGPIHIATYWGMDKILNVLLLQDTLDINVQDSFETTALQLAAMKGHLNVVQLLMDRGAEINTSNHRGESSLYFAAKNGHTAIVELLLVEKADIGMKDYDNWNALDWTVIGGYNEVLKTLPRETRA